MMEKIFRFKKQTRPMLRYHGGKWTQRKEILKYMQTPHDVFSSWFTGGGSLEMEKKRVKTEVWNDRWGLVYNLYNVMRDKEMSSQLEQQLRLTPYGRDQYKYATEKDYHEVSDPVELARLLIVRSYMGFSSGSTNPDYSTSFRGSSARSGAGPARDWANYPDQIKRFTQRLSGVTFENKHYKSFWKTHDKPSTLNYADPPYVLGSRTTNGKVYAYEMSDADHIEFLQEALSVKGQMIISSYETEMYNDMLEGWGKISYRALADGSKERTEVLYINPHCMDIQPESKMVKYHLIDFSKTKKNEDIPF